MTEAPDDDASWITAIKDAIAVISADRLAGTAADWDRFAAHQRVVATVYGPYDTGKTALIKRLLVEAGIPVPNWLRVSARRETFTAGEVAAADIIFRDTPGTGTGDQAHEQRAADALALTDVLLITWPSTLATAEHRKLGQVICGDHYGQPADGYFPAGALVLVIGRGDTLHPDAKRDVDGYRANSAAKRAELAETLRTMRSNRSMSTDRELPPVHVLCADPFELVGSQEQPSAADYDAGRAWDGIAELRADLAAIPVRLPELRAAAAVRYWSLVARQVSAEAATGEAALVKAAAETAAEAARLRSLSQDLKHIRQSAAGELRRLVTDVLRSAYQATPENPDVARALAESRLDEVCASWALKWSANVNRVLDQQLPEAAGRPDRDAFRVDSVARLLGRAPLDEQSSSTDRKSAAELLYSLAPNVEKVSKGLLELKLDDTIENAAKEVKGLGKAVKGLETGSRERRQAVDKVLTAATSFESETEAKQIRGLLRTYNVAAVLLPLAQIGLLADGERRGRRDEQRERDRQEELGAARESAAEEITVRILGGQPEISQPGLAARIDMLVSEFDADYREQKSLAEEATAAAVKLAKARATLSALITERPRQQS